MTQDGTGWTSDAGEDAPSWRGRPRRRLVALLALVVTFATAGVLGGPNTADVILTIFTAGVLPLINLVAATLLGMAIVRRAVPGVGRALQIASGAGVGLGILITLCLLLGLAGLLNAVTAWLVVAAMCIAAVDVYVDRARWLRAAPMGHEAWLWLLPAAALGVCMAGASIPPGVLWGDEPHGYDVLSYHLQIPREWFEAGRIVPLEHNVFSHFPLGEETLFLLMMHQAGGPWEAMYPAQILSLLLMVLATVGVYGAVSGTVLHRDPRRPPRHGESTSAPMDESEGGGIAPVVAAVIFATVPWAAMLGSVAYNEALLMFAASLVAAWLLRALDGDWRAAGLAGLFVGLGLSAKYPAAPMLGISGGLALLAGSLLPARRLMPGETATAGEKAGVPWQQRLRQTALALAAFVGGAAIFSLPWLLRNLAWSGNPVFPLATGLLGDAGWAPELIQRWDRAHALAEGERRLPRLLQDVAFNWRFGFVAWPLGVGAIGWLIARRQRVGVMLATWLTLMLLVWIGFTHLQGRFLVVSLPVLAVATGLALGDRLRFPGIVVAGACAVIAISCLLPNAYERTATGREEGMFLYGFDDLVLLTPIGEADAAGREVYLVGEAKAFLYQHEAVQYRAVFNVPPASGAIRAWLGDALFTAPDGALVVIDPAEVSRLSQTYGTPPLEVNVPESIVVPMGQVRQALGVAPAEKPWSAGDGPR